MITIEQIVSSNLEMLKEQEASLRESLDFVQKAIALFESQGSSDRGKRRGRRGRKRGRGRPVGSVSKNRSGKGGTHLDRIMSVLKQKNTPLSSGDLIDALFKQQSDYKDRQQFSKLIYPTLTKAYKNRILKLKRKKIHLT